MKRALFNLEGLKRIRVLGVLSKSILLTTIGVLVVGELPRITCARANDRSPDPDLPTLHALSRVSELVYITDTMGSSSVPKVGKG
jgi:hypothetical protein